MYDGSRFHGWQFQPNGISVQEVVEKTLFNLTGENIKVTGCSRTDAGVHAKEFYFNFFAETRIPCEKIPAAFNSHLKTYDIAAVQAYDVHESFNARFSSTGKKYVYKILNSKTPDPFLKNYSWFFPYKINIEMMNKAAKNFIGKYDFSAFMASDGSQKTTIRTIRECSVSCNPEYKSEIDITIEADAFLYNMVRIITGTLCDVGTGKISPDSILDIINSRQRKNAGMTAPPEGLHLVKVYYPEKIFDQGMNNNDK